MDWSHILAFLAMALVIEVSPGPNFLLIAKTVPTAGRAAATANISGFAAAFLVHGALSIFGFSVVLSSSASLFFTVKMLGAAYLCYLGIQALLEARPRLINSSLARECSPSVDIDLAGPSPADEIRQSHSFVASASVRQSPLIRQSLARGWREGFITNCLNPKISMFYLAAFPQFIGIGSDTATESFFLVMIHIAVNAVWFLFVAIVIERLMRAARSDRFVRVLKMSSGVALIGFGASFAASATAAYSP